MVIHTNGVVRSNSADAVRSPWQHPRVRFWIFAAAWAVGGLAGCDDETNLSIDDDVCITRPDGSVYCIDTYEASRIDGSGTDQGTSDQGALSVRGRLPWTNLEWADARAACERSGKRLCTVDEWEDACDGTIGDGGNLYPYGEELMEGVCVTELTLSDDPLPTGSRPGCISDFGVYDLGGNVWEWVGTTEAEGQVIGGGIASTTTHRCTRIPQGRPFDIDDEDPILGFRCCRDP